MDNVYELSVEDADASNRQHLIKYRARIRVIYVAREEK